MNTDEGAEVGRTREPSHGGAVQWLGGLRELAATHDAWVIDQWGVLHDGNRAYPGAADALRRLVARGDPVVVLSNSGKRADHNMRRLARLGIDTDCYSALLTSGEQAHRMLARRDDPFFARLGTRCRLISNDGDRSVIDGLTIRTVDHAGDADFVLLCGVGDAEDAEDVSRFDAEFRAATARAVPAICANPDYLRLHAKGLAVSCGELARRYEKFGGIVRWIGKPFKEVLVQCGAVISQAGARRTAMIGDSLEHDVAGAQVAGWTSVLIAGGIHAATLRAAAPGEPRASALRTLCADAGLAHGPDVVMDELTW